MHYDSVVSIESKAVPGVRFAIYRVSFGRRMELSRRVREISRKAEFLEAGTELHEKIEANILAQEIDAMYLQWGLVSDRRIDHRWRACHRGAVTGKGSGRPGARGGGRDQGTVRA